MAEGMRGKTEGKGRRMQEADVKWTSDSSRDDAFP